MVDAVERKRAYNKWYSQQPHVKKKKARYIVARYNNDELFKKKQLLSSKINYMENRNAMIAKSTLYNKLHSDKVAKYQRKYWRENKEEILKKQRERYARQHAIKKANLIRV